MKYKPRISWFFLYMVFTMAFLKSCKYYFRNQNGETYNIVHINQKYKISAIFQKYSRYLDLIISSAVTIIRPINVIIIFIIITEI